MEKLEFAMELKRNLPKLIKIITVKNLTKLIKQIKALRNSGSKLNRFNVYLCSCKRIFFYE
jgi:hypothetical protein